MMAYDERSIRGRADAPKGSLVVALVVGLAVVLCFAAFALICSGREAEQPSTKRHDSLAPTYTHDGEEIRWYVFVDPDTQRQYLYSDHGHCTPRLERDETPTGEEAG